jgi:hypothetical protein
VLDQVGERTGVLGMAQAGDDAGHVGGFGCAAKLRDDVRPNKAANIAPKTANGPRAPSKPKTGATTIL